MDSVDASTTIVEAGVALAAVDFGRLLTPTTAWASRLQARGRNG